MVRAAFTVLLIVSLLGSVACGDDDGEADATTAVETASTTAEDSDDTRLAKVLLKTGEEPGFKPAEEPRTDHGLQSLGGYSPQDVEQLRRAGFLSITSQPLSGDDGNAGVATILLFKTAAGARAWLAFETSDEGIQSMVPGAKPKRFTVPGVPGARGWTGRDRHGNPIGHVFWAQGRCELVIGNEGEGDFVKPLSTGAKAVYDRTNGVCPA